MAFIREYSMRRSMATLPPMGDPGFGSFLKRAFKPPRAIRKMQPGKLLGKVVSAVAPVAAFLPGVGGLVARLGRLAAPVRRLAQAYGFPEDELAVIVADRLGIDLDQLDAGDPGAPRPQRRRKTAAAGPKAKAQKKRGTNAARRARGAPAPKTSKSFKLPEGLGRELGELIGGAIPGSDFASDLAVRARKGIGLGPVAQTSLFGRKRRHMNPANVKALRRGIRRVEGFTRLVKSVQKAFPAMRPHKHATCGCSRKGGRK